jgi:hypothetical protein
MNCIYSMPSSAGLTVLVQIALASHNTLNAPCNSPTVLLEPHVRKTPGDKQGISSKEAKHSTLPRSRTVLPELGRAEECQGLP